MKKCVVPGTFDPITQGHEDIILRASKLFDEVVVLILTNAQKKFLFPLSDRTRFVQKTVESFPNVRVESFEGLLNEYLTEHDIRYVVRGVRNASDFEYEMLYFTANLCLNPEIEMLFLPTITSLHHVSSTLTRELLHYHADVSGFLPSAVCEDVSSRYKELTEK